MEHIELVVHDQIAVVTINRPSQRNAINYAMWADLPGLCASLEGDPDVRVVIWTGAGAESFSAGGDISEFEKHRGNASQTLAYNDVVAKALDAVLHLSKPTIALIKGYCVGGGLLLAGYCDLRIAAENARFGIPVARLGMPITFQQMQRFVQLVGSAVLLDLLLTARLLDASEAHQAGLCSQLVPQSRIDADVMALAHRMASLSPETQAIHKRMLRTVMRTPDLGKLSAEDHALLSAVFDGDDYREGVRAFLEKRSPCF